MSSAMVALQGVSSQSLQQRRVLTCQRFSGSRSLGTIFAQGHGLIRYIAASSVGSVVLQTWSTSYEGLTLACRPHGSLGDRPCGAGLEGAGLKSFIVAS